MLTLTVCNQQNRRILWEIFCALQQVDSRLQLRTSPPLHMDGFCETVRTHDALIVGCCIAEYQTNSVNIPRCTVAGDRAQGCGKERTRHRTGGIQHNAERFFFLRLQRMQPRRSWNIRRRTLPAAYSGIGAVQLLCRKMLHEPCAEPDIPGNRWNRKRMNFFNQSGWQESTAAAFVILKPTLQCAPVKVVHLRCILRGAVLPINKVAGAQLFIAAQFRQQAVIDGFCGQTMKLRIIQCAIWHTADVHFQQPIIYHKITGNIPEQRVSPVQPLCVLQRGMQKFMC